MFLYFLLYVSLFFIISSFIFLLYVSLHFRLRAILCSTSPRDLWRTFTGLWRHLCRSKFHQHFMITLFIWKCYLQHFCIARCCVCIFGQKEVGKIADFKMLMNLTTGVKFINILHTRFLYKSAFLPKSFCQNPFAKAKT